MESVGYHITSLLLRLFILYTPYLIEAGKVYKAMPPLYMIPNGKKRQYYLDNTVMARETQKLFKKTCTISSGKNVLSDKTMEDLVVRNADYVYELESAAMNHGVSPELLEIVLMNHASNGNIKSLEEAIKKAYRFVNCTKIKGIEKIEVSENQLYTIYCTDDLFNDCAHIIRLIKANESTNYSMNGEPATIYRIMKAFESTVPAGVQRYKGLGEMDPDQLKESTMDINTRTLIRYTVTDVKEEVERIRRIESDKKQIFQYIDMVHRDDLIGV